MNDQTQIQQRELLKISPHFDSRKLIGKMLDRNFDDFVDVYEDRINGWLLDWAKELNKHEHAGFAALALALSFFEGFAVFYYGKDSDGKSREFFDKGFRLVFPQLNQLSDKLAAETTKKLYSLGRCGLLHLSMVRRGVFLRDGEYEFLVLPDKAEEVTAIFIDRHKFVRAMCVRFDQYVCELRDESNTERRCRFKDAWLILHKQSKSGGTPAPSESWGTSSFHFGHASGQ